MTVMQHTARENGKESTSSARNSEPKPDERVRRTPACEFACSSGPDFEASLNRYPAVRSNARTGLTLVLNTIRCPDKSGVRSGACRYTCEAYSFSIARLVFIFVCRIQTKGMSTFVFIFLGNRGEKVGMGEI